MSPPQSIENGPGRGVRALGIANFVFRAAMGGDVVECLDLEATHHVHAGLTEDHRNAAKAFVEKKKPVFSGR